MWGENFLGRAEVRAGACSLDAVNSCSYDSLSLPIFVSKEDDIEPSGYCSELITNHLKIHHPWPASRRSHVGLKVTWMPSSQSTSREERLLKMQRGREALHKGDHLSLETCTWGQPCGSHPGNEGRPHTSPRPKLNHGRILCCWGEVEEGRAGGYPEGRPHEAVGADSGWPFWKVSFVVYH